MRRYVIANSDGEIVRVTSCMAEQSDAQALPGEVVLEDDAATWDSHHVVNGALVAYSVGERTAKAVRPAWTTGWDNTTMAWIDPRDLAARKADKWTEIKAAREAAEYAPFTWDGSSFDADSESQRRIQGASQLAMIAAAASQPFEIDWTLADNSVRALSGAEMIAVGLALGTHVATQYVIARGLREAIESATTQAEVEAVSWPS